MTDITKCSNEKCERKEGCWRWLAPDDHWQSYAEFKGGRDCDGYWKANWVVKKRKK